MVWSCPVVFFSVRKECDDPPGRRGKRGGMVESASGLTQESRAVRCGVMWDYYFVAAPVQVRRCGACGGDGEVLEGTSNAKWFKRMSCGMGDVMILLWGNHSGKSLGPSLVLHKAGGV